ncbi:MAG TPA: NAD(+)/NADH kinase [Candidatus Merdisoma merdipullorum]|nr:NAD(+)/NADH kinase [Candidatus Merdisoma merdipullorum]
MNRFYVITNSEKDKNLETTGRIYDYLKSRGCECTVREYQGKGQPQEAHFRYTDEAWIPEGTECILVLGGDGTLIQAARDTVDRKIPLLGINLGTLGYLAEIEKSGIPDALDSLLLDNYTIEPRMLLEGSVYRETGGVIKNIALNDIVVNRAGALRVIDYEICVNGEYLNRYSADGMIVSTPTGSTGYSLSAGGPIVSPMASMIVVTPICPHTLTARSIVLSGGDRVAIHIGPGRRSGNEEAFVTFDGEVSVPVETGDYVEIQRSEKTVNILKISRISFLEVLRNKMRAN